MNKANTVTAKDLELASQLLAKASAGFNPEQLSTWDEVIRFRDVLNTLRCNDGRLVGGGVKPLNNDPNTSGGYLPIWSTGPHGDPSPFDKQSKWYHFRFNNGFEGVNVGLVRGMFWRYPNSPLYVLGQLQREIG